MTDSRAIQFRATDTGFEPLGVHAFAAFKKQYHPGQRVVLIEHKERSGKSHRHWFSCLKEAHDNLPERWAIEFPTVEKLRKYVLIRVGWCNHTAYACDTERDATTLMRALKSIDEFALVKREGSVVNYFVAKSQSEEEMNAEEFARVKDRALDFLAQMLGTSKDALTKNAGRAA